MSLNGFAKRSIQKRYALSITRYEFALLVLSRFIGSTVRTLRTYCSDYHEVIWEFSYCYREYALEKYQD